MYIMRAGGAFACGLIACLSPQTAHAQAQPPAQTIPTSRPTLSEEAEIAKELAQIEKKAKKETTKKRNQPWGRGAGETRQSSSALSRGLSNLLNPAISANGVLLVGWSSREEEEEAGIVPASEAAEEHAHGHGHDAGALETGFHVQEIELRLSAVVDAYFRADITIAAHAGEIAVEEASLTTLDLPLITLRGGQIFVALGRHNRLHTHAFPFITAPMPWRVLLGDEGLKDPGLSAELLLPLPFYSELIVQAFRGDWALLAGSVEDDPDTTLDEAVADKREERDFAYVAHLKTLFDIGDEVTIQLGATYLGGRNGFGGWNNVVGADLSLKWRPIESDRYVALEWTTEYLWVQRPGALEDEERGGGYSSLRLQFARRWWAQARGAILALPSGDDPPRWRAEALLAFLPSEFSAFRLQYGIEQEDKSRPVHEVFFQAIFSIGPHPPHDY